MSQELFEAGALRQFRHNNDVSPNPGFVAAYDKDITDREFARIAAKLRDWQEAYENMAKFAESNGLNITTSGPIPTAGSATP